GFAPLVALVMSSHFGLPSSGIYLLSGAVCTLLAISINRQFASRDAEAVKP
ncbi:TPA: MFS transporter, partial [Pseudomonas aeruginosa]|nr:MFS transporter [Pseudomonas aeruginosa]HBP1742679.1 MFS transporter [Pseudomonas aeruginosa]